MKRILEAIMAVLSRNTAEPLPTGPNPLPSLDEFSVKKRDYALVEVPAGHYKVSIDEAREVGFFEHATSGYRGMFWLAGHILVGHTRLLPCEVKHALADLQIEV